MNPRRFRKRPVDIQAAQLNDVNADAVAAWCGGCVVRGVKPLDPTDVYVALDIPTLEGTMRGNTGDWIIRGVKGEFYPCKPDIFDATYEALDG